MTALLLAPTAAAGSAPHGNGHQGPQRKPPVVDEDPIAEGTLHVTVLDESGEPIEGVPLHGRYDRLPLKIDPDFRAEPRHLRARFPMTATDTNGTRYVKCAAGRAITLRIRSLQGPFDLQRHEPRTIQVPALNAGELRNLEIVVRTQDDATFRAKLIGGTSGQAVEGAMILTGDQWEQTSGASFVAVMLPSALSPELAATPCIKSSRTGELELGAATWRFSRALAIAPGFAPCEWTVGGRENAPGFGEPITLALRRESFLEVTLLEARRKRLEDAIKKREADMRKREADAASDKGKGK